MILWMFTTPFQITNVASVQTIPTAKFQCSSLWSLWMQTTKRAWPIKLRESRFHIWPNENWEYCIPLIAGCYSCIEWNWFKICSNIHSAAFRYWSVLFYSDPSSLCPSSLFAFTHIWPVGRRLEILFNSSMKMIPHTQKRAVHLKLSERKKTRAAYFRHPITLENGTSVGQRSPLYVIQTIVSWNI